MRLSRHSKLRMSERANINKRNQKEFYIGALRKGKSPNNIKNEKLKEFLYQLESTGCKTKVHKGYIFIHSKNGKTLYTMYEIPKKLLETEEM